MQFGLDFLIFDYVTFTNFIRLLTFTNVFAWVTVLIYTLCIIGMLMFVIVRGGYCYLVRKMIISFAFLFSYFFLLHIILLVFLFFFLFIL